MFYVMFRFLFWILLLVIFLLLIKKLHINHRFRWTAITFIITLVLTTIVYLFPIENAFMTFSSPQSAYRYNHFGYVNLVINGKQTDFVVASNGDTDLYSIVPKTKEGWKIGMGSDTRIISQTITDGIVIYVYQYKNSDDYYIIISNTNEGPLKISDSCDSKFISSNKTSSAVNKDYYTYYAYINNFNAMYEVIINDKVVEIS